MKRSLVAGFVAIAFATTTLFALNTGAKSEQHRRGLVLVPNPFAERNDAGWKEVEAALNSGDVETALAKLLTSAQQGEAWAQVRLGTLYRRGRYVSQDYHKALVYYRQAARQKHYGGLSGLDLMYENEFGVDHRLAVIHALHLLMREVAEESSKGRISDDEDLVSQKLFFLNLHLERLEICYPPIHSFVSCSIQESCDPNELFANYQKGPRRAACEEGENLYRLWTANPILIE